MTLSPARLLRVADVAEWLQLSRTQVSRLVENEQLPARVITTGPNGRRSLRFVAAEVSEWIETRREKQIRATLDGRRYGRQR